AADQQVKQLLVKAESSLAASDWLEGGSCDEATALVEGCRREVVSARAVALGRPYDEDDCGVVQRSAAEGYTMEDVTDGATLGVLHSCESEGEVLAQGTDACSYSVCASFSWTSNGTLNYEVVVSHSIATGLARTVSLEVYLNYDGDGGAPVSGDSTSTQCAQETACSEATECGGDTAEVKVLAFDSFGDGWSDPLGNATEE
ncbi:unnamed protein product, partial [Scytosiphon promiscuus]